MATAAETLEQVSHLLGCLPSFVTLGDEPLVTLTIELEQAGRLLDSLRVAAAAEIDDRSRPEVGNEGLASRLGQRRAEHLLEQLTRVSQATAVKRIRLGRSTRARMSLDGQPLPAPHPFVASALASGSIGTDVAALIVQTLDQCERVASPADLETSEKYLVDVALKESADLVKVHALVQREALDPDGAPERTEELRLRRGFRLGRESHGMTPFSGVTDPANAALMRAAFTESLSPDAKPRFFDKDDWVDDTGVTETRTREQRQHDVLFGMLMAGMRAPMAMRSTSTVMAVIRLEDLESGRGVGWLNDVTEPISACEVQVLACDSGVQKIVLGSNGEILHLGLKERFFSAPQRKAFAVRDGGCVWPGCQAPPSWCHAHHVIHYEHDGPTDINNGTNPKYDLYRVRPSTSRSCSPERPEIR